MIKVEEVKGLYNQFFVEHLGQKGYKFLSSKNKYVRQEGDWSFTYFFVYTGWSQSVSIHIDLLVSYKKINAVYKKIFGYGDYIINAELGTVCFLSDDGQSVTEKHTFTKYVEDVKETKESIQDFKELLEEFGEPFFEKYSDIETVYALLCDPPYEHSFITMPYFDRAANSIILESQLQRGRMNTLVTEYGKEIAAVNNASMNKGFKQLLEYLSIEVPANI